ncbi:hypothetical protein DFH11DRAFT_1502507 [Phellopilus nigrolimitatus]|nr:hypothetical protein DFH11DRAFT_1502507 [Phellopilus nigrolimitatus]
MVFILLFEVLICVKIYQNAYIRAGIDRSGFKFFMLRLAGFSIYAVIALIVAALFLSDNRESTPYILQASLPLAVLIFIGTQKEVLATWSRWLRLSTRNGDKFFDGGLHQRSRSTTALMDARPPTPSLATPDFVQLNEFPLDKTGGDFGGAEIFKSVVPHNIDLPRRPGRPVKTGLSGMETFFNDPARPNQIHTEPQRKNYTVPQQLPQQVYEPPRPQESVRPYDVQIPVEPRPHNNFANEPIPHNSNRNNFGHNFTGLEKDSVRVIATQKETISRLLEEAGYMNKALDRLKNIEQILHKTQNAVVGERRTVTQLKGYVSQMESDLQNQSNAINNLLVANKELEDKHRYQEEELHRLAKETISLSDALQHSVKNEMQWKDKYSNLKKEHSAVVAEVTALKNERDVLLDIWSTLDSPVDWEMQKGRGPSRGSPPFPFPELAEKFRQRASTPVPRPFSKSALRQTRRQTDAVHPAKSGPAGSSPPVPKNRTGPGVPMDSLDRLRPRMLELSGKMELSEKVGGLEELVREQTAMIEQLEAVVDEERRERIRLHVEGSMGSWSIPDSISSSMIAERDVASHASASEAKVT